MSNVVHIRRCHVCGATNEVSSSSVRKCESCGKHLAPFYYFDEAKMEGLSIETFYLSEIKSVSQQYHPIWGLSTYWTDDDEIKAS